MAIILNDPFARGGGAVAGQEFGNLISSGLQQLAQHKMQQIQQRNQARVFQQSGLPQNIANLLAQFSGSPETQRKLLQSYEFEQQAESQETMQSQPMQEQFQQFAQPQQTNVVNEEDDSLQPDFLGQKPQVKQPKIQTPVQQPTKRKIFGGGQTPQMQQAERHFQQKQITDSYKLHKPALDQYRSNAARAKQDRLIYNQLSKLNDSGKLVQGRERQILQKVGLEDFFTNPGSELAGKLTHQLTQGAAAAFNTKRLTNFEVGSYERTLPRLINTQKGMRAILKNKDLEAEALEVKQDSARSVVKEYTARNEPLPFDIEDIIEERSEPQLKVLADKAQSNIDEALSSSERRSFEMMPKDLGDLEGKTIRDTKTGATFKIQNGKRVKV